MASPSPTDHKHRLRNYKFRNQKQWICIVPFCTFLTRNPLDLLGQIFTCCHCSNIYRFENEDTVQKHRDIQCPLCSESTDSNRIVETTYLNSSEFRSERNMPKTPKSPLNLGELDSKQAADIVIADLIKEQLEKS